MSMYDEMLSRRDTIDLQKDFIIYANVRLNKEKHIFVRGIIVRTAILDKYTFPCLFPDLADIYCPGDTPCIIMKVADGSTPSFQGSKFYVLPEDIYSVYDECGRSLWKRNADYKAKLNIPYTEDDTHTDPEIANEIIENKVLKSELNEKCEVDSMNKLAVPDSNVLKEGFIIHTTVRVKEQTYGLVRGKIIDNRFLDKYTFPIVFPSLIENYPGDVPCVVIKIDDKMHKSLDGSKVYVLLDDIVSIYDDSGRNIWRRNGNCKSNKLIVNVEEHYPKSDDWEIWDKSLGKKVSKSELKSELNEKYGVNSMFVKINIADAFSISKVIFNDPATIVFWKDGSKTIVKCGEGETYDREKGLAMAIAKKALGNKGNYYDTFKEHLPAPCKDFMPKPEKKTYTELIDTPLNACFCTIDNAVERLIGDMSGEESFIGLERSRAANSLRYFCRERKIVSYKQNGKWYVKLRFFGFANGYKLSWMNMED